MLGWTINNCVYWLKSNVHALQKCGFIKASKLKGTETFQDRKRAIVYQGMKLSGKKKSKVIYSSVGIFSNSGGRLTGKKGPPE